MANAPVTTMREKARKVAPKLIDLTEKVLFGDVWERPGLSKRDRSLITVATLMSTYRPQQLRPHLQRAPRQWRHPGRNRRADYALGVLLRLAGSHDGRQYCQRGL